MQSIILYTVAEYSDFCTKLTIKVQDKQTQTELWNSLDKTSKISTTDYKSIKKAHRGYKQLIGGAILGGWRILNAYPKKVTWKNEP